MRGRRGLRFLVSRGRKRRAEEATVAATEPVQERRDPEPAPAPEPDVTPGPSLEPTPEPEGEPSAEPAPPETPPDQPRVSVGAAPPVAVSGPRGSGAPAADATPGVVPFTARSLGVPQQWNLWELERVVRERGAGDAVRDEERSFLLMYLRDFANADGVLPTSFDGIVREAFGDVLDGVRG